MIHRDDMPYALLMFGFSVANTAVVCVKAAPSGQAQGYSFLGGRAVVRPAHQKPGVRCASPPGLHGGPSENLRAPPGGYGGRCSRRVHQRSTFGLTVVVLKVGRLTRFFYPLVARCASGLLAII